MIRLLRRKPKLPPLPQDPTVLPVSFFLRHAEAQHVDFSSDPPWVQSEEADTIRKDAAMALMDEDNYGFLLFKVKKLAEDVGTIEPWVAIPADASHAVNAVMAMMLSETVKVMSLRAQR